MDKKINCCLQNVQLSLSINKMNSRKKTSEQKLQAFFKKLSKYQKGIFLNLQQFQIDEQSLEQGEFGKVLQGRNKFTKQYYALKFFRLDEQLFKIIQNEIQTYLSLNHPFICKCYDVITTQQSVCLVLELCPKSLITKLNQLSNQKYLQTVQKYFYQLISAISYLHEKGIIHRDLKVDNLMIKQNQSIVIIDFGSCIHKNLKQTKICGLGGFTTVYCPPELLRGIYQFSGDIWALGVVIYTLLFKELLFKTEEEWFANVTNTIELDQYELSPFWRQCLSNMLKQKEQQRITIKQLKKLIQSEIQKTNQVCFEQKTEQKSNFEVNRRKLKIEIFSIFQFDIHSYLTREKVIQAVRSRINLNSDIIMQLVSLYVNKQVKQLALNSKLHFYSRKDKILYGFRLK